MQKLHTRCGMGACQGRARVQQQQLVYLIGSCLTLDHTLLPTRVKSLMAMSTSPLNQK